MAGTTVAGSGIQKVPPKITPPLHRALNQAMAAGTALTNGTAVAELVNISNCCGFIVRILTAGSASGTLLVNYVRPMPTMPSAGVAGSLGYTTYGTNQPPSVAVTAGTEAMLMVKADGSAGAYNGEHYILIQFTPSGSGTLTWCDIAMMARAY